MYKALPLPPWSDEVLWLWRVGYLSIWLSCVTRVCCCTEGECRVNVLCLPPHPTLMREEIWVQLSCGTQVPLLNNREGVQMSISLGFINHKAIKHLGIIWNSGAYPFSYCIWSRQNWHNINLANDWAIGAPYFCMGMISPCSKGDVTSVIRL